MATSHSMTSNLPQLAHPDGSGKIRAFAPEVPALFLTAKDAVQDRITGLAAGGDDYVTKPFSMEEVLLRLHRLVQRSVAAMDTAELVVGTSCSTSTPGKSRVQARKCIFLACSSSCCATSWRTPNAS
jgi:DNA-binding response OmpR family regulator